MHNLDLGWFVNQHLRQREGDHFLDVREFTEDVYSRLAPEQRRVIDRARLERQVMRIGLDRFAALRW
jgi:hypothetical protein